MTPADALALAERSIRRGMCSPSKRADKGCQICDDALAAIETLRSLVALPDARACAYAAARRVIDSSLDAEEAAVRGIADVICGEYPPHELPDSLRGAP